MKVLNVLLLAVFTSSASAKTCRRHHAKIKDKKYKLATAFENNREAVDEVIEDEYLIMHDAGVDPRALLKSMIKSGDAKITNEYTLMNAFSVHMKKENLDLALKNLSNITIFENPVVTSTGFDSPVYAWGVDRSDQIVGTNNQYQYERSGDNVDVYILDTGVYIEHNDFQGRARHGADFTGEGNQDDYGHGSHVAGTTYLRNCHSCYYTISFFVAIHLLKASDAFQMSYLAHVCNLNYFRNCWG
jgi:subtilisin family serine protease